MMRCLSITCWDLALEYKILRNIPSISGTIGHEGEYGNIQFIIFPLLFHKDFSSYL